MVVNILLGIWVWGFRGSEQTGGRWITMMPYSHAQLDSPCLVQCGGPSPFPQYLLPLIITQMDKLKMRLIMKFHSTFIWQAYIVLYFKSTKGRRHNSSAMIANLTQKLVTDGNRRFSDILY